MVASGPSLYAKRQYAQAGYSERTVIIALTDACSGSDALVLNIQASLTDSLAPTDVKVANITTILTDVLGAADAVLTSVIQTGAADGVSVADVLATVIAASFSEALSASETFTDTDLLALADTLGMTDAMGSTTEIIGLSDFILIKEFISLRLRRSIVWAEGGTSHRGVVPHIYGQVLYARNMYSTNIAILWGAIQRSRTPGFTNTDGHKYNN
jgi:hypothetical protein